tara:strand:+ start:67306 stop:67494 length:189 start_codon:yes stop_codon:yes gene_type:complete
MKEYKIVGKFLQETEKGTDFRLDYLVLNEVHSLPVPEKEFDTYEVGQFISLPFAKSRPAGEI